MRRITQIFHKHVWFDVWQKIDAIWFVLTRFKNSGSRNLYELLEYKLTAWGLHILSVKNMLYADPDYRKHIHDLWVARQYLRWIIQGKAEKQADDMIQSMFKTKYEFDMPDYEFKATKDHKLEVFCKFPRGYNKDQRQEMREFMNQLTLQRGQMETSLHTAYVYKVYDILRKTADDWW